MIAVLAATVLGATIWSLQAQHRTNRDSSVELHNIERIAHADGIEQLPPDYSKLARTPSASTAPTAPPLLGSPLPGDLGGPLFHAEQEAAAAPSVQGAPTVLRADPAADAARVERINRQREAEEAAKAPLFFRASTRKDAAPSALSAAASSATQPTPLEAQPTSSPVASAANPTTTQNMQEHKRSFLERGSDTAGINTHALQSRISPYQVMAGTVIAAALITGINSDVPGQVLATVTEPVYDTATGRHLLIPQGSRLLGQYDSQVAFGQRRVLLVWNRLMFPDASSIALNRLPGVDPAGYAGLEDAVDWHWQQLLLGAALSTLIGVGAELAAPDRSNGQSQVVVSTRQSIQDTINQVGQELTRRNLNVQPTLTIRPGFPVRVIVNRDLVLRLYQPLFFERSSQ